MRKLVLGMAVMLWTGLLWAATPALGTAAPDFALPDQNGSIHRLANYHGQWLVLYFYPKDNTPGCTTEAQRFRDDHATLRKEQVALLGVSVDNVASHRAFADKHQLPFPLLADETGQVAAAYGALGSLLGMKMAKRQTFLIDPAGRIAKVYTKVDPTTHSQQVLSDLRTLRHGTAAP
jgi:peroxiredoxin Q/BCP